MPDSSKTGLIACQTKTIPRKVKGKPLHFRLYATPAPVALRQFAGIWNPYGGGCGPLCNHPASSGAKAELKRARQGRYAPIIAQTEVQAIRDALQPKGNENVQGDIPEVLFRRYTETDSRPLTPAPTLASVKTRGSSSRRCVTPDPVITSVLRERTLLILDLRRSHSQEIISWTGTNEIPVINILKPPTPSISIESPSETPDIPSRKTTASPKPINGSQQKLEVPQGQQKDILEDPNDNQSVDGEEDVIRRRGKRKKKRGRDSSRGPLAVQASIDPETQVSALGTDCVNTSARPSLVPTSSVQDASSTIHIQNFQQTNATHCQNSILQPNILKHLQRELNTERLDLEFNDMKKEALKEALRALPQEKKPQCEEYIKMKQELNLPPINEELWLSLPRVFSRRSARFELPLHSRLLEDLTPLEYLKNHCNVSNGRRLLYNLVFNRHKQISEDNESRIIENDRIRIALGEMMGKSLSDQQYTKFLEFIPIKNEDIIDFKTWCGICAFFERVFAIDFCPQLPNKEIDPCNEVEIADFQSLFRRLKNVKTTDNFVKMLEAIRDL